MTDPRSSDLPPASGPRPGGVHLVGHLRCRDAADAALVAEHLPRHVELTRAEPGCLSFEVTPTADPLVWQVVEHFATPEAFAAHQARVRASEWGRRTTGIPRDYTVIGLPGALVTTPRLRLERITPELAARIVRRDERSGDDWHPEYPFADELAPLRHLASATHPDPVFTMLLVREQSTGLAVGGVGFLDPPGADGAVEIGYGLIGAARGTGCATEAVRAAIILARVHGAREVRAETTPDNLASQRVLEKAGLTPTGRDGDGETLRYSLPL